MSKPGGRHAPLPITPPPGLGGGRTSKLTQVHKATTDLLTNSWGTLGTKLQQQLEQLGIKPAPPTVEPDDLTSVLKENMAQLPTAVKDLVEKITKPPPETEKDMAMKLKAQVSHLRDLSHKKQVLEQKLDNAKKTYGDMLEEMKSIQTKLEAEQGALHSTSAAYMALVNTCKPAAELHEGETMEDTVPNAVAGFITTLGVSLTEDQKAQLTKMLKRPPAPVLEEESKRRKTVEEVQQCLMPRDASLLHLDSCVFGAADDSHQPLRDSQSSCGVFDNLVDSFAVGGSRRAKGSRGGYGPWREPSLFKLGTEFLYFSADPTACCSSRDPTGLLLFWWTSWTMTSIVHPFQF